MIENAAIQAEKARLRVEYLEGIDEGYSKNVNMMPIFFALPYIRLSAYQRGYVFGRELKLQELEDA